LKKGDLGGFENHQTEGIYGKRYNHLKTVINVEQPPSAVLSAGEGACSTFSSKFEISGIFARASKDYYLSLTERSEESLF
jgi:hypothetical protein